MDAEVDGGEVAIGHEDEVAAVGVGDDDLVFGVEVGGVIVDDEFFPTGV